MGWNPGGIVEEIRQQPWCGGGVVDPWTLSSALLLTTFGGRWTDDKLNVKSDFMALSNKLEIVFR